MKRVLKLLWLALFVMNAGVVASQQVSGHWYGIGMIQTSNEYNSYLSELILRQKGSLVWGELAYYFKDSLVKAPVKGLFDEKTRKLDIKPFPMIYYRSPNARNSIDANLSGNFTLVVSKTASVLSGNLSGDDDHKYTIPAINYRFTRSDDTVELVRSSEDPDIQKDTIPAITPAADATTEIFSKRARVYTRELEIENSSVKLEIYDNGEIDNDSISLFLNDKMILPRSMLTHKAIHLTIELDQTREFNELSMFALNLGMIPPNTAALVLYDGKKRYETLLSSDLNKSATLKLKRKR